MFFDSGESGQRRGCAPAPVFDPGRGCLPDIGRGRKPVRPKLILRVYAGVCPGEEFFMENITAEVIVELYTKYQLLSWWLHIGVICSVIFAFLGLPVLIIGFIDDSPFSQITGGVLTLFLVASFITALRCSYLIDVVLKPEIAGYAVPAGLDLAERAGREISQMWDILKGLLNKRAGS